MRYYHVTDERSAEEILKTGLTPSVGDNAAMVCETEPAIYLCDLDSIPYWQILLDRHTILSVDTDQYADSVYYSDYREYRAFEPIPPESIQLATNWVTNALRHVRTYDVNRELCINYLKGLSNLCIRYEHILNLPPDERRDGYEAFLIESRNTLFILQNRLNLGSIPQRTVLNMFADMNREEMTMFDTCFDYGVPFYELPKLKPIEELTGVCNEIYDYIRNALGFCMVDLSGYETASVVPKTVITRGDVKDAEKILSRSGIESLEGIKNTLCDVGYALLKRELYPNEEGE